jgi:hypothetical protein
MPNQNIKQEGFCGISLKNEVHTLKINFTMLNQKSVLFFRYQGDFLATTVSSAGL